MVSIAGLALGIAGSKMLASRTVVFSNLLKAFEATVQRLVSDRVRAAIDQKRYRVGRRFHEVIRRHLSGLEHYPMYPVWSQFALSTNLRGREVARRLAPYTKIRGRRYLDVGCAYGGYPIAFAARGAEAVGIDINPQLLGFAACNVRDQRVPVLLLERDVTKPDQIGDLGLFDIITCNDLIEHVHDVPNAFTNISSLLRPGGLLFLQIPNAWSVGQILKDGHYGLFGITLLARPDAIRYFHESGYNDVYDVGQFHRLNDYVAFLNANEIRLHGGDIINGWEPLDTRVRRVRDALSDIRAGLEVHLGRQELSSATKDTLSRAVENLLSDVTARLEAYDCATDDTVRHPAGRALIENHEIEFWEMIGVKDMASAS